MKGMSCNQFDEVLVLHEWVTSLNIVAIVGIYVPYLGNLCKVAIDLVYLLSSTYLLIYKDTGRNIGCFKTKAEFTCP